MLTKKEIKNRSFAKTYENDKTINCHCGCGKLIKNKDKYGRDKMFINGHNGRIYEDPLQYKKEWRSRNKKSLYEAKIKRGHQLKIKIIELLGGKCENCKLEYNGENGCVFQVHHIDPSDKMFVINTRTLTNYSWNKIEIELKKCKLLCSNCHFIYHNAKY